MKVPFGIVFIENMYWTIITSFEIKKNTYRQKNTKIIKFIEKNKQKIGVEKISLIHEST